MENNVRRINMNTLSSPAKVPPGHVATQAPLILTTVAQETEQSSPPLPGLHRHYPLTQIPLREQKFLQLVLSQNLS
jgi:hypothetical protein